MKQCQKCGCVNDNVNKFCRNCGADFSLFTGALELPKVKLVRSQPVPGVILAPQKKADEPEPEEQMPLPAETEEAEETEEYDDFFDIDSLVIPTEEPAVFGGSDTHSGIPPHITPPSLDLDIDDEDEGDDVSREFSQKLAPNLTEQTRIPMDGEFLDYDPMEEAISVHDGKGQDRLYAREENYPSEKRRSSHPVINNLKNVWGGGVMLTANIVFTLWILLVPAAGLLNVLKNTLFNSKYDTWQNVAFVIVPFIPIVILLIGLWMIYASAVTRKRNYMSTKGVSVARIGLAAMLAEELIFICLFVFALGTDSSSNGFSFELVRSSIESIIEKDPPYTALIAGLAASLLIVIFVQIVCSFGVLRAIRKVARTGQPQKGCSVFFIVISIINGLGSLSGGPLGVALILYAVVAILHRVRIGKPHKKHK